jgi:Transglutaminase-like superfamily
MRMERAALYLLLMSTAFWAGPRHALSAINNEVPSRKFDFTCSVSLTNLPKNIRSLRIWIPVATSNQHQTIKLLSVTGTVPLHITHETQYGDRMAYAAIQHPRFTTANFKLIYRATRRQYAVASFHQLTKQDPGPVRISPTLARFIQPDPLVPIDGEIKQIADKVTRGRHGEIEKAHAIYDYVFHHMRYDKSGSGWGHGDAIWACNAKHGNCTDFHSLFIGMMRPEHIPARFVIGFPLPPDKRQGIIPGYHCWAEFYVAAKGWVPVDISEAWLNPGKYGFYFGSVDANKIHFSARRDITLSPRQSGGPVNYFVYPYVEINGKACSRVRYRFSFRDGTPR